MKGIKKKERKELPSKNGTRKEQNFALCDKVQQLRGGALEHDERAGVRAVDPPHLEGQPLDCHGKRQSKSSNDLFSCLTARDYLPRAAKDWR
jgi:hypothetical protein